MTMDYRVGNTYAWRSLAAFLAKTVFPRSVANFRIRAFSGSSSVIATLISAFCFHIAECLGVAAQGLIYQMLAQMLIHIQYKRLTEKSFLKSSGMQNPRVSPVS